MKKTLLLLTLVAACFTLGACANSAKSKSCCAAHGGKSGKTDACCATHGSKSGKTDACCAK